MVNGPVPGDLHIAGIHKSFGSVHVLDGVSVDIPDGQFTTLLGPSGCGKTTMINVLTGMVASDGRRWRISGAVRMDGVAMPADALARVTAIVPQVGVLWGLCVFGGAAGGLAAFGMCWRG